MAKKKIVYNKVSSPDYLVYTDGGCASNPGGPGGAAAVIVDPRTCEVKSVQSRGYRASTNNRMEMRAVIMALNALPARCTVRLYADSQYVINCMAGIWSRSKNTDLWEELDRAADGKEIDLRWVKGHSGDPYNELCDAKATEAIQDSKHCHVDLGYEKAKREGREFYKELDRHLSAVRRGGAMAVKITLPETFLDQRPSVTDVKTYAKEKGIHTSCAKLIRDFYTYGGRSFKDYMALKTGGMDDVSRKKTTTLFDMIEDGLESFRIIREHLPEERDAVSALRWHVRGLTVEDSIRKILVDSEVRENAELGKRNRW